MTKEVITLDRNTIFYDVSRDKTSFFHYNGYSIIRILKEENLSYMHNPLIYYEHFDTTLYIINDQNRDYCIPFTHDFCISIKYKGMSFHLDLSELSTDLALYCYSFRPKVIDFFENTNDTVVKIFGKSVMDGIVKTGIVLEQKSSYVMMRDVILETSSFIASLYDKVISY